MFCLCNGVRHSSAALPHSFCGAKRADRTKHPFSRDSTGVVFQTLAFDFRGKTFAPSAAAGWGATIPSGMAS